MAFDPDKLPAGPAPLQELARFIRNNGGSGSIDYTWGTGTEELSEYQQKMLDAIRQFDPDARFEFSAGNNSEGSSPNGQKLYYDASKLPGLSGPGKGQLYQMADEFTPMWDDGDYQNKDMFFDDPNWGKMTYRGNEKKQKDPWWVHAAPLAVGMLAPWAAGGLAAAGIGGTAGLTAGVTGSGMGAAAGGWLGNGISSATKALPRVAASAAGGDWSGVARAGIGMGLGAMGGMGGTIGQVGQGLSTVNKWLPLAQGAYGMMRRK